MPCFIAVTMLITLLMTLAIWGIIYGIHLLIERKRARDRRIIHLYQEHYEVKYK